MLLYFRRNSAKQRNTPHTTQYRYMIMKEVKVKIANELFNALHEANMADCADYNDLESCNIKQTDLYGHLCEAIKALGYSEEYEQYCETGDRPEIV